MTTIKNRNKQWLLKVAKAVAAELKIRCRGTVIKIRTPSRATSTNTSGWVATIGNLGKNKSKMEIWLDRFAGHKERKLYAAFSGTRVQIKDLANKVKTKIVPVREITTNDTEVNNYLFLPKKLPRKEFGNPILEKHGYGQTYLGKYEFTSPSSPSIETRFVLSAVAFFESVAKALQKNDDSEDDDWQVYPKIENRKQITSHLQRERSSYLATECKIRDDYTCKVCGLIFEEYYGKLGNGFAEAHHLIPLHQLRGKVKTGLEDLITVCANCHRMLHRMDGKLNDFLELKKIIGRKHPLIHKAKS